MLEICTIRCAMCDAQQRRYRVDDCSPPLLGRAIFYECPFCGHVGIYIADQRRRNRWHHPGIRREFLAPTLFWDDVMRREKDTPPPSPSPNTER